MDMSAVVGIGPALARLGERKSPGPCRVRGFIAAPVLRLGPIRGALRDYRRKSVTAALHAWGASYPRVSVSGILSAPMLPISSSA